MKYMITASKNHIELLVPGQIRDRIPDPEQILVYRNDLRHHRNRRFLGNDRG